jgi:hypothetical protein
MIIVPSNLDAVLKSPIFNPPKPSRAETRYSSGKPQRAKKDKPTLRLCCSLRSDAGG